MQLTEEERHLAGGAEGEGTAIAMRIVLEAGRLLGADRLIPIASGHVDGCLYHGDSGTEFAEFLARRDAKVRVATTLNVSALDLLHPGRVRLPEHQRGMARRLMQAYETMGCRPTWTCTPYQAGHRPALGTDVAWGESNAVVFCNSVLGARTNRYGDFLDIACAITGRAPRYGLHAPENRKAEVVVDVSSLSAGLRSLDAFWPVFGAWYGRTLGERIGVVVGLEGRSDEDRLKAMGASAAAFGAVSLFHIAGVTPEAPSVGAILAEGAAERIEVTGEMIREARGLLSTATGDQVDAVAVGSPHLSYEEFGEIERLMAGRSFRLPFYANTGRGVLQRIESEGRLAGLGERGLIPVVDTCIVVTPILPGPSGVLLTNSGKFSCYAPGNTGYEVQFGSLSDCVESAVAGRLVRDEEAWR